MAKKRKLTKTQAFRKNLNRRIKAMQKRGYYFEPEDILKISKLNIWQLRKEYSDTALYQKAVWISPETQEVIQGTTRREMERRIAARKAAATRRRKKFGDELTIPQEESIVLSNLLANIETIETSERYILTGIVNQSVEERGSKAVARAVQNNLEELQQIIKKIKYLRARGIYSPAVDAGINTAITRFATILYDRPLSSSELFKYAEAEEISGIEQSLEFEESR